ncbi:MAG TPA: hypothetical protein VMQ50_13570 [Casimicrobiaceae bacterium]|nr:hypothetical protein [Casimicrobiaceae bacterium]
MDEGPETACGMTAGLRPVNDEVVEADLDRPETFKTAFAGAHGVFLVTNSTK